MNISVNNTQNNHDNSQTPSKINTEKNNLNLFQKIVDRVEKFFLMIFTKIGLKKFVNWYIAHQEGMRYLVFGALSTVINIITFALFSKILKGSNSFTDELVITISNVIAWVVAVLFAYITNKLSVFCSKTDNLKELIKEIIYFFGARIFTLLLETIFLNIFINKLHFNEIAMKVFSNIMVIIVNFIFSKLFIFKKK